MEKLFVKKDIAYYGINGLLEGETDIGITINGINLVNMEKEKAIEILNNYGLVKNANLQGFGKYQKCIVIPKGFEVINIVDLINYRTYKLKGNIDGKNIVIEIDLLFFDSEGNTIEYNEFIG